MKKYYFISYKFIELPRPIMANKPQSMGDVCTCIDIHPFEWMVEKLKEGFATTLYSYQEIPREEFNLFVKLSGKKDKVN